MYSVNVSPASFEMSFDAYFEHVSLFAQTFGSKNDPNLRFALVGEEAAETWKAIVTGQSTDDIEGELGDLLYVVLGWFLVAGIDPGRAMKRTALKNQQKINNRAKMVVSKSGKVIKPRDDETAAAPEVLQAEEKERLTAAVASLNVANLIAEAHAIEAAHNG